MRELKFRAWDKIHKKMWYSTEFGESEGEYGFFNRFENGMFECGLVRPHPADPYYTDEKKLITMQWTGLCDQNGTEIYEGDILQYFDSEWDEYFKASIRWADEYACFLPMGLHTGKVIGNIYENPELLKGE